MATLCALWGVDAVQAMVAVKEYESLSLLELEFTEGGLRAESGASDCVIGLHDLAIDFCAEQVRVHGEDAKQWHAALLNGYLRDDSHDVTRAWWSVRNDGYIYIHVIRHLLACHEFAEAAALVLDFRYILAQVKCNELHFVTQDIDRVTACLGKESSEQNREAWGSKLAALELLGSAIRTSWSSIVGDARALPHRLAFQLLGRINQCKTENADVERFLRSVGEYGPAPFLRPLSLTLSMPRPGLRISVDMKKMVIAAARVPRSNRVVVVTWDSTVPFVVDISTGQTVRELIGHESNVSCVTSFWSGSTAVAVSGGGDGTVRFWSAETGQEIGHCVQATEDMVEAVAASKGGAFVVSGSRNGAVQRWRTATREEAGSLVVSAPESLGHVRSVAISSNGRRVVAGTMKGDVWLWDLECFKVGATVTGVKLGAHRGYRCGVRAIAITADGETVVSGGYDCAIHFWGARQQCADGDPIKVISVGDYGPSLCVSHDCDKIYYGLYNGDIHVYDARSRMRFKLLRHAHTQSVYALEASADGRQLLSGGWDGLVRLWDLPASAEWVDGGERPASTGRCTGLLCIATSTDGRWVVTGHNREYNCAVQLWDAATGEADGSALCSHTLSVRCVAVAPDSRRVVSGSFDGTVRVWGVHSREEVLGPLSQRSPVHSVAISGDGSRIVSGSLDGTLRVWAMATGADLFGPLCGHSGWGVSVAISHDGRWIASGAEDGATRLLDLRTEAPAGEPLQGHFGSVYSAAFSADSQHMIFRDWGGDVWVWSVATRECVRVVKRDDRLHHASVEDLAAMDLRATSSRSTLLSLCLSARSRYVYQGDPADENIVAVFDSAVVPNEWHFDSERQRLWVVFEDGTLGIADFI